MEQLAEDLRFEEAEEIKRKYLLIESFVSKSEVVSHTINNVDVFTITNDEKTAFINYLHVANGAVNQSFTFEFKKKLDFYCGFPYLGVYNAALVEQQRPGARLVLTTSVS